MGRERRDRSSPQLLRWRQVSTRLKLLGWRQFYAILLQATVVGGGMAAFAIWVEYDNYLGIVLGAIAGIGTAVMLILV